MPCGCAANRAAKLAGATIAQSTASARNTSENPGVTSQSTECPGCPLEEIRQRADQAVGSAQAFRDTASSASPTTRSIEAGQTKTDKPATEVKDSFERIKQDLGAFNLKRYIPKPKDQQEEERKAQSGVQFAEKPPSDGFEVLHDKASVLKKGLLSQIGETSHRAPH